MRRTTVLLSIGAALLLSAPSLRAQSTSDTAAPIVATVQRLFDAMMRSDTAGIRALVVPGTNFVAVMADAAASGQMRAMSDSAFLQRMTPGPERLLERVWAPVVQVQGPIATLWAPYDFHRGSTFSHCGIDTFTLVQRDGQWRIAALVYTVQRTGCAPSPLGEPR